MRARNRFRSTPRSPRCRKQRAASSRSERVVPPSPNMREVYQTHVRMSILSLPKPSLFSAQPTRWSPPARSGRRFVLMRASPPRRGGDTSHITKQSHSLQTQPPTPSQSRDHTPPALHALSLQTQPRLHLTVPSPRQYHYAFWLRQAKSMVPPARSGRRFVLMRAYPPWRGGDFALPPPIPRASRAAPPARSRRGFDLMRPSPPWRGGELFAPPRTTSNPTASQSKPKLLPQS